MSNQERDIIAVATGVGNRQCVGPDNHRITFRQTLKCSADRIGAIIVDDDKLVCGRGKEIDGCFQRGTAKSNRSCNIELIVSTWIGARVGAIELNGEDRTRGEADIA